MANRQNLGEALGMMLSGGFDKSKRNQGYEDGVKAQLGLSNIDLNTANIGKANAETALKQQEANYGTDESLISGLLSSIGANSPDGINDFKSTMAGNYKPLVGAPTQQQAQQGNTALPQPVYLNKFADLQQKYAGIKQMLALRDTNYDHLSQGLHGDQLNQLTNNITPQNAVDVANNVAAFNGKPDDVLKAQLTNRIANDGKANGSERGLLYMQGKPEFNNMGSDGTFSGINGNQSINAIGQSVIEKNQAEAQNKINMATGKTSSLNDDALTSAAETYRKTGAMPLLGSGGRADKTAIMNRATELDAADAIGGSDSAVYKVTGKATAGAIGQLQKQYTMTAAFEKNAKLNSEMALKLSDKVDRTGIPVLNKWIQAGQKDVTGNPDVSAFHAANQTFVNEYAKIMSGSMGNTAVSDATRQHAESLLSTAQTPQQYKAVMKTLNAEMDNRMAGFDKQLEESKASLSHLKKSDSVPASTSRLTDVRLFPDGRKVGRNASGKLEVMQ